jgi:hypothetical protein
MSEQIQVLGRTGTLTSPEGQYAPLALATDGRLLVKGGDYVAAKAGRLLVGVSASAGIAIIAAATGGGHPTLFNPLNSGRIVSIRKLLLGYVSGNNAPTSLAWNITENAGSQAATGAAIPTATAVAAKSAMAGGLVDQKSIWSPTTNTFTAAPAFYRPCGLSLFTGVAATAVAPWMWHEHYDDDLLIAPGTALSLVAQAATTTALFRVGVVFEEVDE